MLQGLYKREATGRTVLVFELAEEFIAAGFESAAQEQEEAEVSDVKLQFFPDAAVVSMHVKVRGKAWPPRPPVDTRVEFAARDITHSEVGESGSVLFRVEKPLTFSSTFADILMGLFGKLTKRMPISIDALRHQDSLITVDFAQLLSMMKRDMSTTAAKVRLYGLKVSQGQVRVEVGFLK